MEAKTRVVGDFSQRLRAHWFSLGLTALLLFIAILKYRNGLVQLEGIDLAMPYACTRAWLEGSDPYDAANLMRIFHEAGGQLEGFKIEYLPPIYPPTTFIVMMPIAWLPWEQALRAWGLLAVLMLAILIGSLLHLAQLRWADPRTGLLVLFCIVLGPVRSSITLGQNALPAICFAVFSAAALSRGHNAIAGILLAFSLAFKPQDALFVFFFALLIRRWRTAIWCIAMLTIISLIAIFRFGFTNAGWIFDVLYWIGQSSAPGAITDPAAPNAVRFQMIHLPVLLSTILDIRLAVGLVNGVICSALGGAICMQIFIVARRSELDQSSLVLFLSALGVFSLLPVYHRFPDGIILLLPAVWAIGRLRTPDENLAKLTLLLILPFMVQPHEILTSMVHSGRLSHPIYEAWWFQCFVRASLIWVLLAIVCWLTFVMWLRFHHRDKSIFPIPATVAARYDEV